MLRVRFWGTRGSLAKPGPHTLRHGGNTSCVEVHAEGGEALVLDSGTGIHDLGQTLVAAGRRPVNGHLLITHTHWDHIQGFPFFTPLYAPGNTWDVYAPRVPGQSIEDVLAGQMAYTYFPITLEQLGATIRYHNIVEESFDVGPVRVSAQYVNHPAVTVGFRLEAGGATVVYATDHEPHAPHLVGAAPPAAPAHREDGRHLEFLAGADLLIHDAQFTLAEYPARVGWGHTPAEVAVDYALAAGARQLALFHHDPLRHDDALDALVALCQRRAAAAGGGLEVFAADEGATIEVRGREEATRRDGAAAGTPRAELDAAATTILIADDDPDTMRLLTLTLRQEGYRLVTAADGDSALALARAERPALVLLDWTMPGIDGLAVCRAIRADADPRVRALPVVLLTARAAAEDTAAGFASGVTDYLTKPFNPAYVRSRVRAWLMRASATAGG